MENDQGTRAPSGVVESGMAGLQFDKVDAQPDAGRICAGCQRRIEDAYFAVGGRVVCEACSAALVGAGSGVRPLVRALLYGGGAALVSTIVWYLIIKVANMELGLIAIGVGLFIGMAVRKGAGGRGGWKYQALAMLLTYGAVTLSKAPLVLQAIVESSETKKKASGDSDAPASSGDAKAPAPENAGSPGGEATRDKAPPASGGPVAFVVALLFIVGIALASPFLGGAANFMGIIIIAIALYEAWKLNKRVPVQGPFRLAPAVAREPLTPPPGGP